jgi:Tol biopolymer transport system component
MRTIPVTTLLAVAVLAPASSHAQQVRLISRAASGASATGIGGHSWLGEQDNSPRSPTGPTISADGRFVVFSSAADNLVPGQSDNGSLSNVFRYDRLMNTMLLISRAAGAPSMPANKGASKAFISANGCLVAFESGSTDLLPGPVPPFASPQVFLYDCSTDSTTLVSHSASSPNVAGNGSATLSDLSADGAVVVFATDANDLVAGGAIMGTHLFAYDRASATTLLVSHAAASATTSANASAFEGRISADGRFVTFSSLATDLVTGFVPIPGGPYNVFVQDRLSGVTGLVSRQSGSTASSANGASMSGRPSADGRWIAFVSEASNLVPGQVDTNPGLSDVFLFDRLSGTTTLVSHASGAPLVAADESSFAATISRDGGHVAFGSLAANLVPAFVDGNGASSYDLFLFDRLSGANTLVSHVPSAPATSGDLDSTAAIVINGGGVAFQSFASNLLATPVSSRQAFLFDPASGSIRLASHISTSARSGAFGGLDGEMAMSANGRYLGFGTGAPDMVAADGNAFATDVFLFGPIPPLAFHTLTPCRAADTRSTEGPAIPASSTRDLPLAGKCGVPLTAEAVAVNLTVVSPTAAGYLTAFAAGHIRPDASNVNFSIGQTRPNSAVVWPGVGGRLSIFAGMATGQVDVLLDVVGYFE